MRKSKVEELIEKTSDILEALELKTSPTKRSTRKKISDDENSQNLVKEDIKPKAKRTTKKSKEENEEKVVKKAKTAKTAKAEKEEKTVKKTKTVKAEKEEKPKKSKAVKEEKSKKEKVKKTTKAAKANSKKTVAKKSSAKTKKAVAKLPSIEMDLDDNLDEDIEPVFEDIVEYYDLPYGYNNTVVKVLYQDPTTLFVYWEVSENDVDHFKKEFGDNFFYITRPVLIVHNNTQNYSFEVAINDFANNWYIHVDDAKCQYSVKLARIPSQSDVIYDYDNNRNTDFVEVSNSNIIEMPNDHVLFYNNGQKLYFKNIKTNAVSEKVYKLKSTDAKNVKAIYKNYELSEYEDRFDFRNPSSQNPTSNVM